ncbi:winged helix-turn-helix transcriptional regulator [Candidatus Woesearchaeota archaeon]|nr:winged helix-turn-helix transcriptional regulator [Candidatus Woesearchaeota archaeon]
MKETPYKLFFRAVSNKTRCDIVSLLMKGPKSVTQLCRKLGFEQSRVSHNLKCLEMCGFVSGKYEGKSRVYSLTPEVMQVLNAIDRHLVKYHEHLKSCGALENHMKAKR